MKKSHVRLRIQSVLATIMIVWGSALLVQLALQIFRAVDNVALEPNGTPAIIAMVPWYESPTMILLLPIGIALAIVTVVQRGRLLRRGDDKP